MPKYKKRPDGRYTTSIVIGHKDDGTPIRKCFYAKTIREIDQELADYRALLKQGIIERANPKFTTIAEEWRNTKNGLAYRSQQVYDEVLKAYILPKLGAMRLKDIKLHDMQTIMDDMQLTGKIRTAQKIRCTLKQIYNYAVSCQIIAVNLANYLSNPPTIKTKRTALTHEQIQHILGTPLPLKERIFVYLLLFTGLRRGEALALSKSDIDRDKHTVTVSKSLYWENGSMPVIKDSPKTQAGNRTIMIPDRLWAVLDPYIAHLPDGSVLFPMVKSGKPMTQVAFRWFWSRIYKDLGIENLTPHVFRHTYATSLYYAGVDIKAAQYLLGHSSARVTMDIYTHLDAKKALFQEHKLSSYFDTIKANFGAI
jgi:integrase